MRVYVAGPISGHADLNRAAFTAAAEKLTALGHIPVTPFDLPPAHAGPCPDGHPAETGLTETHPRPCWIRADLIGLLGCDAYTLLTGWEASVGACLEATVGEAAGLARVSIEATTTTTKDDS